MDRSWPHVAWANDRATARAVTDAVETDATTIEAQLLDPLRRVAPSAFPRDADEVALPGLYAWFVDSTGAAQLSEALGGDITPGLIYVGQAGAGLSSATLASRVGENHLRGNVRRSTFRFTLASALTEQLGLQWIGARQLDSASEAAISGWIGEHLTVAVAPLADRVALWDIESE